MKIKSPNDAKQQGRTPGNVFGGVEDAKLTKSISDLLLSVVRTTENVRSTICDLRFLLPKRLRKAFFLFFGKQRFPALSIE